MGRQALSLVSVSGLMHKQVVRGMLGGGDDGENQMSNCFGATDARNERTRVRVSCNLRLSHHRI
jgi:hypothetical protein